jgi:hypothetical protein
MNSKLVMLVWLRRNIMILTRILIRQSLDAVDVETNHKELRMRVRWVYVILPNCSQTFLHPVFSGQTFVTCDINKALKLEFNQTPPNVQTSIVSGV